MKSKELSFFPTHPYADEHCLECEGTGFVTDYSYDLDSNTSRPDGTRLCLCVIERKATIQSNKQQ